MAQGILIVELYEYLADSEKAPRFEYVPCELSGAMGKSNSASLDTIIEKGFASLTRREVNTEKQKEVLRKLKDAGFGKIIVSYKETAQDKEPYIELTNVSQVSMAYADLRKNTGENNNIVLNGRYSFSESGASSMLKDAQRLTIIFSAGASDEYYDAFQSHEEQNETEICLNITYLIN